MESDLRDRMSSLANLRLRCDLGERDQPSALLSNDDVGRTKITCAGAPGVVATDRYGNHCANRGNKPAVPWTARVESYLSVKRGGGRGQAAAELYWLADSAELCGEPGVLPASY